MLRRFYRALMRSKAGLVGFAILLVVVVTAILAPILPLNNPVRSDLSRRMNPPTITLTGIGTNPLGNDQLGRDILSRIIYGARVTLTIGAIAVCLGGLVGVILGLVSGYFGGWPDRIIMRIVDMQLAFPLMLLALTIVAVMGPSLRNLIIVLALTSWTRYARIVRGEVLSLREREFVMSARAAGASSFRILRRHVLPNVMTPAIVVGTLELARVIVLESALSFLGLGIQPPNPSWGRMLAEGRNYLATAWWIATIPGVAILLTVLSINLVGDWLRDTFDPKLRAVR